MLVAANVAEQSPEDANSHALRLLCMEALGKVHASPQEALGVCLSMLQCDGLSHRSVPLPSSWLLSICRFVANKEVVVRLLCNMTAVLPASGSGLSACVDLRAEELEDGRCAGQCQVCLTVGLTVLLRACSAAAMVSKLCAEESLPAADVAEALMLHIEACTPLVREQLTHWQPRHKTSATEQPPEQREHSSSSAQEGLSESAEREGVPDLPLSRALGDSWQGLADVICQAGRRALESLPRKASKALQVADPHEGSRTPHMRGAMQEWDSVKQVLDSRAWWWSKTMLDAKIQAWYLSAVESGFNAAGAMTITSDIMIRKQVDLEERASIMKKLKRNQAALGKWFKQRLIIANEILQKLY